MGWYLTITEEMREQTGLAGNELLVYALIAGYSQNRKGCYYGSIPYIMRVCGIARRTAINILNSLEEKDLIEKDYSFVGKRKYCTYMCKNCIGANSALSIGAKNAPNNKREEYIKERVNTRTRESFSIPSLEEVRDYCEERGNEVDAEEFVDFYTSKGWKVGNQKMKDWKACIRTWERNKEKRVPREKRNKATTPQEVMEHNQRAAERLNDPKFWEEFFNGNK